MIDKVFEMYRDIKLGNNEICKKCKEFHESINCGLYGPASL